MQIIIDKVDFWDSFEAMKYWSHPKTYDIAKKREEVYNYIHENIEDIRLKSGIKHLLTYINKTQKRNLSHLQEAIVIEEKAHLKMDVHTKRNLELTETLRLKQRNYSLIWLLDKTKTAMGSRLLRNYIENPLIDKKVVAWYDNEASYTYQMVRTAKYLMNL